MTATHNDWPEADTLAQINGALDAAAAAESDIGHEPGPLPADDDGGAPAGEVATSDPSDDAPERVAETAREESLRDDIRRSAFRLAQIAARPDASHVETLDAVATVEAFIDEWRTSRREAVEWPEAVPIFAAGPPEPLDMDMALPPHLAEIVRSIAWDYGVHEIVPLNLLLATLSAAAGNGWQIRASRTHVEPNLARFSLVILDPGERKSPVFRPFMRPLEEAWLEGTVARDLERRRARDLAEKEAAQVAIKKKIGERVGEGSQPKRDQLDGEIKTLQLDADTAVTPTTRFWGDDVTSQKVAKLLEDTGGTFALLTAEGRDFIANLLGAYRTDRRPDDTVWLRIHGGDALARDRMSGEDAHVPRPGGSIGVLVQSDIFGDLAKSRPLHQGGFIARLHVTRPPSLVGQREVDDDELDFDDGPEDDEGGGLLGDIIVSITAARYAIVMAGTKAHTLKLERSVRREALAWAMSYERRQGPGGDLRDEQSRASKVYGEALRLAGLIHLAETGDPYHAADLPISADTWRRAAYLSDWSFRETRRSLAGAKSGEWASWALALWEYVDRNGKGHGPFTTRDIARFHVGDLDRADWVEQRLRWIADMGWAKEIAPQPPKRKSTWLLRPERLTP